MVNAFRRLGVSTGGGANPLEVRRKLLGSHLALLLLLLDIEDT